VSNNPGANEMLALLDALKGATEDFAAREEKLNNDFRTRFNAERDAFEARRGARETKLTHYNAEAEAALVQETSRLEDRFQKRKTRINHAHTAVKKQVEAEINRQENQLNQFIREHSSEAEQERNKNLAKATAAFEAFQQKLNDAGVALEQMAIAVLKTFRGCGKFRRLLSVERTMPGSNPAQTEFQLFEEFQRLEAKVQEDLKRFQKFPAPQIFRFFPLWLVSVLLLGVAVSVPVLQHFGRHWISPSVAIACLVALAVVWIFYWFGTRAAQPLAIVIADNLAKLRCMLDDCLGKNESHHTAEQQRIKDEFDATIRALNHEWKQQNRQLVSVRGDRPMSVDEKAARVAQKNEAMHRIEMERFKQRQAGDTARFQQEMLAETRQSDETHKAKMAELERQSQAHWRALEADWKKTIEPLFATIHAANAAAEKKFPDWNDPIWKQWTPPTTFQNAAKFARLEVTLKTLAERMPKDERLALPGPSDFSVPLSLAFPLQGSLLFETAATGGDEAIATINNLIFRLLSTTPPGKLSLTIFDPVGLGQNFAALMHLADYEESSINSRIWTQSTQFEEKLAELNEHMEKVIQMYLRNEYATIAEYNAEAGTIAEKYHVLVIASFPVNFSETAARRLRNIAASGARCGVYTLIQWDKRTALPQDIVLDELRKTSLHLVHKENSFQFSGRPLPGTRLVLDPPPAPEFATEFLHQAGRSSKDSTRVEVPFSQVAPSDAELWTENTTEELRVPIGRSGATKLQYLAVGKATRQHALIAGKTGSGKSTLFHVIITNLAMWCSPEQVEFYLVDFKKGVEFKCYANRRLPHAKVVAIESDRAFGLSVLQRVDEELRRRGDLFRKLGAQDLAGYQRAGGTKPMPRSLLIIDEFQEFFVEEDRISQNAAVLLDRIIRQGRAFGIHVLLGSQTLGGAYTLARATIGQMAIRIALQCNEADAYLIMDQDNPAPRLLSRPGEGIYNDTSGSIEGNSPFQTVWLNDQERDACLAKIRARADQKPDQYPGPIVFEGNAPADIRENRLLLGTLQTMPTTMPTQAAIWLGAPNAIKGPTEAVFKRQSGNNLLIVGQSEERALTLLSAAFVSLAAQYPRNHARFIVLDSTPPELPQHQWFQRLIQAIPHEVVQVNNANLQEIMSGLAEDLKRRSDEETTATPDIFILIHGLQNYKKLRMEDEFSFSASESSAASPANALLDLIREGPARGIHIIVTCDTYNNVSRFLGRKTLSEFEMRVLFQMSAGDSASLIDDPAAATLGFYRALLYQDREGTTETFRPYAQPGQDWLEEISQHLARLRA
jgi:DNA segregation ATPase FtsK/SpoIIIE, S-DNA-T family